MKILIAADCYKWNNGGITASTLSLCAALRREGHEVKVLSLSGSHQSFREAYSLGIMNGLKERSKDHTYEIKASKTEIQIYS